MRAPAARNAGVMPADDSRNLAVPSWPNVSENATARVLRASDERTNTRKDCAANRLLMAITFPLLLEHLVGRFGPQDCTVLMREIQDIPTRQINIAVHNVAASELQKNFGKKGVRHPVVVGAVKGCRS